MLASLKTTVLAALLAASHVSAYCESIYLPNYDLLRFFAVGASEVFTYTGEMRDVTWDIHVNDMQGNDVSVVVLDTQGNIVNSLSVISQKVIPDSDCKDKRRTGRWLPGYKVKVTCLKSYSPIRNDYCQVVFSTDFTPKERAPAPSNSPRAPTSNPSPNLAASQNPVALPSSSPRAGSDAPEVSTRLAGLAMGLLMAGTAAALL
jgi:hypothetical protein